MEEPAIASEEEGEEQPNQQQSAAEMEEERAESLAMEVEDDDEMEETMRTEPEEEEGKRIEPEEVDEEEEDDDFGDFKEAAAPPKPPEADPQERLEPGEEQASTSAGHVQQQPQILAPPPQVFRKSIAQLEEEEESIWRCPEEEQATFSSRSMPSPVDLFAQMDAGSSADTRQLDELEPTMLKAYQLWLLLCYVEETRALQFKWDQSQTYRRLLWALHLQKGQRRTKKFPARSVEKRAEEGQTAGQHVNKQEQNQQQNSSEGQRSGSPSAGRSRTTPAPQIDSLMVPPADFDWRQSGLANPLKGQAVSAASAFDCSLLLADTRSGTGLGTMNSTSILEKELAALGLMDSDGSKPARVQNGGVTALSVLDVVKLHQHQQQKQQAGDVPGNVAGVN